MNLSIRWGCRSKRCQAPCTRVRVTPRWLARVRTLQWVASGGLVFKVVSRIFCCSSGVSTRRERLRFCGCRSASTPPRPNAIRVAITVGRDKPVCCAMELLGTPVEASRITSHFRATDCGVVPARTNDSNTYFCDGSMERGLAGVNIPRYLRIPIEAEASSLSLRLACSPTPVLRQMGYPIPRLLGYMSEQAILHGELLSVHKINQAYPGIPTVRKRSPIPPSDTAALWGCPCSNWADWGYPPT